MSLELYKKILLIRTLETELQRLCDLGEGADLHFSRGQEAISVGAIAALRPTDYIVTHHRTIAHAVARDVPLAPLVAEVLGKPGGLCGGRAGEMHLSYPPKRFMFSFQLVGTCVPVAAGIAWAIKHYQKTDDIVAVFFGDAATSNGQWHEGINIAAVKHLPLLLICENNGLAGNVRSPLYLPTDTVRARALGYGIRCSRTDGNQVDAVCHAVEMASNYVRKESRPYLLECETTRLSRHKQGQGDIRSRDEIAELVKRDPLLHEERRLSLDERTQAQLLEETQEQVAPVIDSVLGRTSVAT